MFAFFERVHIRILKRSFIALLIVALSFSACSRIKYSKVPDDTIYKQHDEVIFRLVDDSLTPTSAVFYCENTGNNTIFWGSEYRIQINKKGAWYDLSPIVENYDIETYGIQLTSHNSFKEQIDWSFLYGELPRGDYRILIGYQIKSPTNNRVIDQNCFMICEFSVP